MWEIQGFEKFIVTLSEAANIKVKETCNNLGSACVCVSICVRTTGRNRGDNAANQCCSLASLPAVLCLWISATEMKFSNFSETAGELQD